MAANDFGDVRTDLTAKLGAITASTIILTGDADTICSPAVGQFLRERISRSRHEIVHGAVPLEPVGDVGKIGTKSGTPVGSVDPPDVHAARGGSQNQRG